MQPPRTLIPATPARPATGGAGPGGAVGLGPGRGARVRHRRRRPGRRRRTGSGGSGGTSGQPRAVIRELASLIVAPPTVAVAVAVLRTSEGSQSAVGAGVRCEQR